MHSTAPSFDIRANSINFSTNVSSFFSLIHLYFLSELAAATGESAWIQKLCRKIQNSIEMFAMWKICGYTFLLRKLLIRLNNHVNVKNIFVLDRFWWLMHYHRSIQYDIQDKRCTTRTVCNLLFYKIIAMWFDLESECQNRMFNNCKFNLVFQHSWHSINQFERINLFLYLKLDIFPRIHTMHFEYCQCWSMIFHCPIDRLRLSVYNKLSQFSILCSFTRCKSSNIERLLS